VIRRLAEQQNVHPGALRNWIRQAEADHGERDDRPSTSMLEENRRLAPNRLLPPARHLPVPDIEGGAARPQPEHFADDQPTPCRP
jgi:transposase-like protein